MSSIDAGPWWDALVLFSDGGGGEVGIEPARVAWHASKLKFALSRAHQTPIVTVESESRTMHSVTSWTF